MNKKDNKRKMQSITAIQKAYMNLVVARKDVTTITVSDVCKKAKINRSTFYAHYLDMSDLINSIYDWMTNEIIKVFKDDTAPSGYTFDFYKQFKTIKDNQLFYKLYFKLGFSYQDIFLENAASTFIKKLYGNGNYINYHIVFFSAGMFAVIQRWLNDGCKESPKVMAKVIQDITH